MTDAHTISLYDAVTDLDLAEFLHHLNTLRSPGRTPDPAHRAAFLAHKAEVLTRLADAHAVSDPAYAEQVRQAATEALTASRDDITTTTGPDRCPVCHTRFTRIRRQRYCSDTCRKTAWRRRHTNAPAPPRSSPAPAAGATSPSTPAPSATPATTPSNAARTATPGAPASAPAGPAHTASSQLPSQTCSTLSRHHR